MKNHSTGQTAEDQSPDKQVKVRVKRWQLRGQRGTCGAKPAFRNSPSSPCILQPTGKEASSEVSTQCETHSRNGRIRWHNSRTRSRISHSGWNLTTIELRWDSMFEPSQVWRTMCSRTSFLGCTINARVAPWAGRTPSVPRCGGGAVLSWTQETGGEPLAPANARTDDATRHFNQRTCLLSAKTQPYDKCNLPQIKKRPTPQ